MAIPDQKQLEERMKERAEEQQLFQRFQNVATSKLETLSRTNEQQQSEGGFGSKKLEFGEEEQKIVSRMAGMGLREGILAGLASFVILRRGPKYIGRWVQRRNNTASKQGYQLSDPNKLNTTNNPFEKAARPQDFPRPRGFISRSIWFVFDTVLSVMVGANVSMVYTDKSAIRQQIAELPLVPGKSLVSDALCDEMIRELRSVTREKNPAYERLSKMNRDPTSEGTAASFFLEGIVQFCQNCERRRYLEKTIREQSGLQATETVTIPSPGVPKDGPRLTDESDGDGMQDPFLAETFDMTSTTTSWENDFPSDGFGSDQDGRR